jgi:hypothetical protein
MNRRSRIAVACRSVFVLLTAAASVLSGRCVFAASTPPAIVYEPSPKAFGFIVGDNVTLTAFASGSATLSFQWQFNGTNIARATNSNVTSETTANSWLTLTNLQTIDAGNYRVLVRNSYGSITSSVATLYLFDGMVALPRPEDALDRWYRREATLPTKIRYVGGMFVGVGTNGMILTSPDGRSWARQNSGTTADLRGVAYGANNAGQLLYVVVGRQATVLISTNATNWTAVFPTNYCDLNDVAAGPGGRFVATTERRSLSQPNLIRSLDGTNWIDIKFPAPSGEPSTVAYTSWRIVPAGNGFLTSGASPGGGYGFEIWRSVNGSVNWTLAGNASQYVTGIAAGNGRFVMVGWEGYPRVSTDNGASWATSFDTNVCANPAIGVCFGGEDIAFGNGLFVSARRGLLTTTDGLTWRQRTILLSENVTGIAYGKNTFVVVLGSGLPATIPSGIYQSESVENSILTPAYNAVSNSVTFRISGDIGDVYRLQSSTNLVQWSDRRTFTNAAWTTDVVEPVAADAPRLFYRTVSP